MSEMLRRVISVLCLALLLVPAPMLAVESTWSVVDMQHAMIAENIPKFEQADGSFEILGGDNARSTFAPDAITIDTEKPLWLNLRNTIFHHADFAQIQTLLEDYHRTYFSSLASGRVFCTDSTYRVAMTSYRASGGGGLMRYGAGIDAEALQAQQHRLRRGAHEVRRRDEAGGHCAVRGR